MNESEIRDLAHAWLHHQGYTDQEIALGESDSHQRSGCWMDGMIRVCEDEYGRSYHREMDAVDQAASMAHFVSEWLAGRVNNVLTQHS